MKHIAQNLSAILAHSQEANLIAVSKSQSDEAIDMALELGVRQFGENRLQEAQAHWEDRRAQYDDLTLHYIGQIQSRKVGEIVALFDVIHTVDREKLIPILVQEMQKQGRHLPCFIQVNTGEEPQKGGVLPKDLPAFYAACVAGGLDIVGLMCIPPVNDAPAFHFGLLKIWAQRLGLAQLSMGMSDDYELAARMGATYIRVGSGLFGARNARKD